MGLPVLNSRQNQITTDVDTFTTSQIINVAVLGVAKTGKTAFIKFLTKDFTRTNKADNEITTKRKIEPSDQEENKFTKICVFETNSIDRFHAITRGYHRRWDAIFFIFNSNFEYSLKRVLKWMEDIRSHGSQKPKLVLVDNTFDIDYETKIDWTKFQIQNQPETIRIENFSQPNEQNLNNLLNEIARKKWEEKITDGRLDLETEEKEEIVHVSKVKVR